MIGEFRIHGVDGASAAGGWIGRNLIAPTGMSKLARENLRRAFPEKSDGEIARIIRGMWDNLGRTVGEYAHLDRIRWDGAKPRILVTGIENALPFATPGRGIILFSGHLANWEVMPSTARAYGLTGATVVRPTNNPYVNAWLDKRRRAIGMPELISKGANGLRRVYGLIREGKAVCMLVDQRTSEGILAPFFGRDALTTPAPAALALRMGALLVPVSNARIKGAHFHVRVHRPIEVAKTGDADADLVRVTTAINAFVEERVRERPEQWLWIHKRWVGEDAPLRKRAQALSGRGTDASAGSRRV
jgi:KDO2-lipid IV(A) lauroyltransferase